MVKETKIIIIFVVIIMIAILLPIGFNLIHSANSSAWNYNNTKTVFSLIPIIGILAVVILIITTYFKSNNESAEPIKIKKEYIQPDLRTIYQHNKVLPRHKHHIRLFLIYIIRKWLND